MKYTAWLWYQLEEVGPGHAFAKVCWDDVNNGCASTKFSVSDWLQHFEQTHLDNRDILIHRLIQSFDEFKKATKEQ